MNVDDVKSEKPEGDMLRLIFMKQASLMEKYHSIEEAQGVGYGLLQGKPFNINETRSQELLKNFAWRVVEEITEATEASYQSDRTHMLEELADALHFLVELCIIAGVSPDDIIHQRVDAVDHTEPGFDGLVALCCGYAVMAQPYWTIQQIGIAMNCLKQKPWKRTHILTDERKFKQHIIAAFWEFCKYWSSIVYQLSDDGKTIFAPAELLYDFYFKKNQVNHFRIRSNY